MGFKVESTGLLRPFAAGKWLTSSPESGNFVALFNGCSVDDFLPGWCVY